jgi:hypothetical protein
MHGIGDAPHPVHVRRDHFQARRKALAAMLSFSRPMLADPCPPVGANLHGLRVSIIEEAFRVEFGYVMGSGWPESFRALDTSYTAEVAGRFVKPWSRVKLEWLASFLVQLVF